MTTSWVQTQAGHARKRSSIPLTSTCCRFRKNRLVVPFQLNGVRVKRRRTSCKNTTVLNHRQTSFFSHIEFVRSRALAGCESSNERKRNGSHSKAPTSWTPEFVGLKVRQTSHEAPSQDGESASPPGTPGFIQGRSQIRYIRHTWAEYASQTRKEPRINNAVISDTQIALPLKGKQLEIVDKLQAIDGKIRTLQSEREMLSTLM